VNDTQAAKPLVTLVLLGFQQERFIRDAILGAFAQTYQPLEIILSDDLSSDATFPIMQEMAAAYDGPHRVFARQTAENVGTLRHVMEVAEAASGEMLVLSAGDDISRPERVAKLQAEQAASGSWALYSDYAEIDATGAILAAHKTNPTIASPGYRLRSYMIGDVKRHSIVHGATAAYDMALFDHVVLPEDGYILAEDGALSLLLHILGKDVSHVAEPLVEYRVHEDSLTNSGHQQMGRDLLDRAEGRMVRQARSQANRCEFFLESHRRLAPEKAPRLDEGRIARDLASQRAIESWWTLSLPQKLRALRRMDHQHALWALPRLLTRKTFLALKYAGNRLRHG
jgi:glycosyltransferase involved in cell wall biosynthesis